MGIRNLKSKLQVEQTDEKESAWSNIDLQPTSPEDRNWSPWYFFAFQFSIAFSPTTFNLGASLVAIGLNWWTIVIASFIGTFCCMIILFFNSRGAAIYHVGFPVYLRICSGFYGSLFFIFIRGVVAVLYMGTQTYYASRLIMSHCGAFSATSGRIFQTSYLKVLLLLLQGYWPSSYSGSSSSPSPGCIQAKLDQYLQSKAGLHLPPTSQL